MYNVLEKLRAGTPLDDKDRKIHDLGLCSILKDIHDRLDAAVFDAYGWPHDLTDDQILERLVALNAERAAEEKRGLVRWLRPEFQCPGDKAQPTQVEMAGTETAPEAAAAGPAEKRAFPKKPGERMAAVRDFALGRPGGFTLAEAKSAFSGARAKEIEGALEALGALGLVARSEAEKGPVFRPTARPA